MVGVHQQTGLQSGRSWCPGGESQSSRDEPDLSLWRRGPQNAQPTLASVCTVRIVCVARSCLSSTYLAAGTLPVRVNVVVLNTSVPNEAASFTGRSGHFTSMAPEVMTFFQSLLVTNGVSL